MLDPIMLASKQPRMRKLTAEEYYVRSGIDEKSKNFSCEASVENFNEPNEGNLRMYLDLKRQKI